MQNDFISPLGRKGHYGIDTAPVRTLIPPINALLPILRQESVPIIWVNWGARKDLANMEANLLYTFKRSGIGFGDPIPFVKGDHGDSKEMTSQGETDEELEFRKKATMLTAGSWDAQIDRDLKADHSKDFFVDKYRMSGFWDTPLDSILKNLQKKTLFFAGVNMDQCVYHTLADAHFLGYDCILLTDCSTTSSPDFTVKATIYNVQKCFGWTSLSTKLLEALSKK